MSNRHNEDDVSWKIIEKYFEEGHLKQLIRHQLESFNYFINNQIPDTIKMFNPLIIRNESDYDPKIKKYTIEMNITLGNFKVYLPVIYENSGATKPMYPSQARLRNFTYSSTMVVDINIKTTVRSGPNLENIRHINKVMKQIHIGKIPIMINSDICMLNQSGDNFSSNEECRVDPGGYFIINGSEKTVLCQEKAAENKLYIFKGSKNKTKWSYYAEIKSKPHGRCISPKQIMIYISEKNNGFGHPIHIELARFKRSVPLFIIFRALGVISDKDICNYIMLDVTKEKKEIFRILKATIIESNEYITKESAMEYIKDSVQYIPINVDEETGERQKLKFAMEVMKNDLFPHCETIEQKLYYIGYCVNNLIQTFLGWKKTTDRDAYTNKRLETTGKLLINLFRNYFNKFTKDIIKQTQREMNNGSWKTKDDYDNIINITNVYKICKSQTIENGIKRALATGDFGLKQMSKSKVGVAQVLNRLTYIGTISHLRRINTPIDKSGKLIAPRKLNATSWGFICPAETPEGASVGVVKNLPYLTQITIDTTNIPIYNFIRSKIILIETIKPTDTFGKTKIMVDGTIIGFHDEGDKLFCLLKEQKYNGVFNIYTSIVFNREYNEIHIYSDGGRLVRPIYKVTNNKIDIPDGDYNWNDLFINHKFESSILEYIDPDEQNNSLIATYMNKINKYNYTHCEIHPSTIFGILASCIPFPENNQSPRNTYQCAMGKQAMGVYVTNYKERMDKTAYVLTNPMRPLVDTRVMNIIKLNDIPSGENVIVAIATYSGFNQEDSIIFNRASVDRGLFDATIYKTERDEDAKSFGDEEKRCNPDPTYTKGMKFANYKKLNSHGCVPENTLIENKDIIIGKCIGIKENRNDITKKIKYKDQSKMYRTNEECYLDKNFIGCNGDGYNIHKVRIRAKRKPDIGDKFSSRHGQKGTIGIILEEEDMPFTKDGLIPDIIINPHAIPSRMTIAQLKETIMGKVLVQLGLFGDGTSFGDITLDFIRDELLKLGYEKNGNEVMYNGITGEMMETSIFIGPVFYQRLKHMVNDKQHSRSFGPMVMLTRQPAEGRARDGGLRFGEMERDCMVSHGATSFTKERLYDVSDKYSVHVCKNCGSIAVYNDNMKIYHCKLCGNRVNFAKVNIPYAYKLLTQELITMHTMPRFITN
jgi:DNA-directed RNA polymerase II subunit RPB2